MTDREELHRQADELYTEKRSTARMLLHSLIELGTVTEIECAYDDCILESRKFSAYAPGERKRQRDSVTIDHIVPLAFGGSDMPSNLRLAHLTCNVSFNVKQGRNQPEFQRRLSESLKERWQDPAYRARQTGRSTSEETRKKRSEAMKRHWADPEKRAQHAAKLQRGESHRESHSTRNESVTCDNCGNPFKGAQGLSLHKVRSGCGTNPSRGG